MSRLGDIAGAAATAIAGMTTDDGYNSDWVVVNEEDAAQAGSTFPQAIVDIVAESWIEEAIHAGALTNTAIMVVRVRDTLTQGERYPARALREKLYSDLDDLKKLFSGGYALEDAGVSFVDYSGMAIERTQNGDVGTAAEMTVTFNVRYSQDRSNPENPAC